MSYPNPNPNPDFNPDPNPNQVLDLLNYTMFMAVIGLRIFVLTLLNELNFNPPPNEFSNFHDPAWSIYQVSLPTTAVGA